MGISSYMTRHRAVIGAWLAWAIGLSLFQYFVVSRLPARPVDRALGWTASQTGLDERAVNARLSVPFLAERVAWDSEFYLSIAIAGYEDPMVRKVVIPGLGAFSLNYAFMPGYPFAIRVAMAPFRGFGVSEAGSAVIAGGAVSLISALFAALALSRLAGGSKRREDEGTRAAWFLLVFPSGFFLAQVYTESLFLALALWAIAFARDRRWTVAAILASCAVLTRGAGVALVPAIAIVGAQRIGRVTRRVRAESRRPRLSAREIIGIAEAIIPLGVFAVWKLSYLGTRFDIVERAFFGRILDPAASIRSWLAAFAAIGAGKGETATYYLLELLSLVAIVVSTAQGARRHPDLAAFGVVAIALAFFSVVPQGLVRYALSCPLVFVMASRYTGKRTAERAYTLASVLLMAFLAVLFSLDMWVG